VAVVAEAEARICQIGTSLGSGIDGVVENRTKAWAMSGPRTDALLLLLVNLWGVSWRPISGTAAPSRRGFIAMAKATGSGKRGVDQPDSSIHVASDSHLGCPSAPMVTAVLFRHRPMLWMDHSGDRDGRIWPGIRRPWPIPDHQFRLDPAQQGQGDGLWD